MAGRRGRAPSDVRAAILRAPSSHSLVVPPVKGVDLPPAQELLATPAASGCRRVALAFLDSAVAARDRLEDATDVEALHDFRVALRRTRSWIRAFGDELSGSIRKRHRRRLGTISEAAGRARDAEVHAAWLRDIEGSLRAREKLGAEWLLQRVADTKRNEDLALRTVIADEFSPTATALTKELAVYRVRVDLRNPVTPPTLGQVLGPLVRSQAVALGDRLAAVQSVQDQAVAHAARIAGKRLRYLLEPVAEVLHGGPPLLKQLRSLQDTIGDMHDVHVMAEEVIQAAEVAGAEQARRVAMALLEGDGSAEALRVERTRDPRPGLLAIATHLRSRAELTFSGLQHQWLGERAHLLTTAAWAVADQLTPDAAGGCPESTSAGARTGAPQNGDLAIRVDQATAAPTAANESAKDIPETAS